MRRSLLLTLMATVALSGCVVTVVSRPRVVVPPPPPDEVAVFYDRLSPYGTWVVVEGYGQVWYPRGVSADWRPYVDGHWAYTDDGWLWVSDYEWGWAPFHYGRWFYHPRYRWVWIPGTVWAPAWVAWRHGDGVVGWAPLGPRARWREGVGFDRYDDDEPPDGWCFVGEAEITRPAIRVVARPVVQNVTIIRRTTVITRYTIVNQRIVNQGVDVRHVEQTGGRAVPRYRTADRDDAGPTNVQGDQVRIYRPSRPRPPEAPVVDEGELRRRQNAERRRLDADQNVEHRERDTERRREEASAPPPQREDVRRRQEEERKAAEDRHDADKRDLEKRQQEERDAAKAEREANRKKKLDDR